MTVAVTRSETAAQMRRGGADTVFWDMHLKKRVGTPAKPADPATVAAKADALYAYARSVTACAHPVIGLNELNGSQLKEPWSDTNRVYRTNVLMLLRRLAAHGARPALFVSHPPATERRVARWWRQAAAVSHIIREVYFVAPRMHTKGPAGASREMRRQLRKAIHDFTGIGIPARRLGVALGFHTTPGVGGGRDGLEPSSAWFNIVKLETLAAKRVAAELRFASVWSWGWGVWGGASADADKPKAACVYLWTRDPALCDGPRAAGDGFNASRTQGQAEPAAIAIDVLAVRRAFVAVSIIPSGRFALRTAYLERRSPLGKWTLVRKLRLPRSAPARLRLRLPRGWSSLRVVVPARARPIRSRPRPVFVR